MYSSDLHLSPKFANYLAQRGMLDALINGLKLYRDYQNYPYVLAQKRIIKQSVFKALCEYHAGTAKKPKVDTLVAKAEEIAETIYGKDPTASEEVLKDIVEAQKKLEEDQESSPELGTEEIKL